MSNIAVRVEGLSKQYFIGGTQERYRTFRDTISDAIVGPLRRVNDVMRGRTNSAAGHQETIWALKDISFDIQQGDVVGFIGRNGAGKSTLLKVMSRITEPTEGQIKVKGRIGALLEVGTGFHPELTGRENVYLNGAILGMSRSDIDRKFDEIVEFSGIKKFIDTPVKHYSSGMGLRLGFAVAAHMEPEILIVDEVLAVGDAEFQKKCLGKMSAVASEGRTVLFVSHNMGAVKQLCNRAILLSDGQLELDGTVALVTSTYLSKTLVQGSSTVDLRNWHHMGTGAAHIVSAQIKDANETVHAVFAMGEKITIEFEVEAFLSNLSLTHSIEILDAEGLPLLHLWDLDNGQTGYSGGARYTVAATLDKIDLYPGRYVVSLWIGLPQTRVDRVEHCLAFEVIAAHQLKRELARSRGVVFLEADWDYKADSKPQR